MKIYFAASISGGRGDQELYRQLIDFMKELGHQVLTEHIGNPNLSKDGEHELSATEIRDRDISWLEESDIVVAETTQPSLGVGYELAYAEKINKPVLILHRSHERHLSAMISGTQHFNNINYYSDLQEAHKILKTKLK
ncbi:MAG TPA: nucleoside 2-deoxyribosyltransferase [Candidatus Limosilactobacillus excrementigallinarum]|nr:nucleoside 2-deoxyribosyltransferase [Candidatus Limosilactobacillus excrementigallinarum]